MRHLLEARDAALAALHVFLDAGAGAERAVLIDDLFGRLRLVLWNCEDGSAPLRSLRDEIAAVAEPYWSGDVWFAPGASQSERQLYDSTWSDAQPTQDDRVRVLERHRNRGGWLGPHTSPPWDAPDTPGPAAPPIVVFYSFKGGVGRSTALAAFAIQRAHLGERVAVLDADLDAPGIGTLLSADEANSEARFGVVDYLLERVLGEVDLSDYFHVCRRSSVAGGGEIYVIPAGRVDEHYLGKLARVDLEPDGHRTVGIATLLEDIRRVIAPVWILIDLRAGLADPAGELLGGLAHLHVLFGTASAQTWSGLKLAVDRLGKQRLILGQPQADCIVVQTMVRDIAPDDRSAIQERFAEQALEAFENTYYAEDAEDAERDEHMWVRSDAEAVEAPHRPTPLRYAQPLAFFRCIDEIVSDLVAEGHGYAALGERIAGRFPRKGDHDAET